jgi:hypothetical protein
VFPEVLADIKGSNIADPIDGKRKQNPVRVHGTQVNSASPSSEDVDHAERQRGPEREHLRQVG